MREDTVQISEPPGRWSSLVLLSIATLLAMGVWFSATAVLPQLTALYDLNSGQRSWLTMSVQIGFVVGALISAVFNLADRFSAHRLLGVTALGTAFANDAVALLDPGSPWGLPAIFAARFLTGALLAGVYPPAMKLMATWFREQRGLALGILIGGLALGSAGPHLLAALRVDAVVTEASWRPVVHLSSLGALVGALIALLYVRPGPLLLPARQFHWRHAAIIFTDTAVRRANFGYLGHMWELYAMWAWVPYCLMVSYQRNGFTETGGRVAGFVVIAVGGVGSVLAGRLADRWGRTLVASAALFISGACALVAGFAVDHPVVLTAVCVVWGAAVVADSAQFSSAVSELCDPRYVGTVLTMQTCSGFLLTLVTLRLLTPLQERAGWGVAFAVLALGPVFGIASMVRLRAMPEATKMASGHR